MVPNKDYFIYRGSDISFTWYTRQDIAHFVRSSARKGSRASSRVPLLASPNLPPAAGRFSSCERTTKKAGHETGFFRGTLDRIRTYDLRIRKPMLCPAELRVRKEQG